MSDNVLGAPVDVRGNGGGQEERNQGPKRLSVNIAPATAGALLDVVTDKGVSMTEAVRRLIGYGAVVYRAVRDGGEVLIRKENGQTERIVLLD